MTIRTKIIQNVIGGIFWYPMPFMLLSAILKFISWKTFGWYLLFNVSYMATLIAGSVLGHFLMIWSLKSTKVTLYTKLMFKLWQWRIRNFVAPDHALLAYPFSIFLELELPQIFKKGGLKAVKEAVDGWGNQFSERFGKAIHEMAKRKALDFERDPIAEQWGQNDGKAEERRLAAIEAVKKLNERKPA
jgi:hypothetical protein